MPYKITSENSDHTRVPCDLADDATAIVRAPWVGGITYQPDDVSPAILAYYERSPRLDVEHTEDVDLGWATAVASLRAYRTRRMDATPEQVAAVIAEIHRDAPAPDPTHARAASTNPQVAADATETEGA